MRRKGILIIKFFCKEKISMPKKKKNKIPTISEEEYERYILSLKDSDALSNSQ